MAREFAIAFLQAVTSDPDNWIVKVSHQFVGQCFRVLGLNFNVSVQAFSQTQDHPYRDANPNYIFDPVPLVMTELDKFLDRLPRLLAQVGELLAKDSQGTRFDELTQPLPCYLNLILKWIKVVQAMCKNMQLSNSTSVDRYICEPLARMCKLYSYTLSPIPYSCAAFRLEYLFQLSASLADWPNCCPNMKTFRALREFA